MNLDAGTILAAGIGIIGAVGGVTAFFGKSRGDSIIKYQTTEIQLRDGTIARLREDNAALRSENDLLKKHVDTLKGLVQGAPQLAKLTNTVDTLASAIVELRKERQG